jgi:RNA polymerase sigma-70 factor (ECF subfamily)
MSPAPLTGSGPLEERTDEDLLGLVAARDVDALAALYERHRATAYGVALRVTGSVPAAEDVLQEAFLGVWRSATAFDPSRGSGRGWLLTVVHNRSIDAVRRRQATDPLPDTTAGSPKALIGPDVWPEVAGRLDAVAVRAALASLPEAQREAIELAYWGGLTQVEIAERTGQPLGTVKGRMRLGLRSLARTLKAGEDGEGGGTDGRAAAPASGRSSGPDASAGAEVSARGRDIARLVAAIAQLHRRRGAARRAQSGAAA